MDYKKELNKFKKFEKRLQRIHKFYNYFSEKALDVMIDPDQIDMSCSVQCILPSSTTKDILQCLYNTCKTKFLTDIEEVIKNVRETSYN